MSKPKSNWYLSFDCATKSLAVSFAYIDIEGIHIAQEKLSTVDDIPIIEKISTYREDLLKYFRFIKGWVVNIIDYMPKKRNGGPPTTITTIMKIIALKKVIQQIMEYVHPFVNIENEKINIIVEFQFSVNGASRLVEISLLSLLSEHHIYTINPKLKNKLSFSLEPESRHEIFIDRFSSRYTAAKNHSLFCFLYIAKNFRFDLPKLPIKGQMKDLADSFMQILAHIKRGNF